MDSYGNLRGKSGEHPRNRACGLVQVSCVREGGLVQ